MNITHLPAATQRAEQLVSVDGNRCRETTGDRLTTANTARIAYAEQTERLLAANRDAAWNGSLTNDVLRSIFVNAPRISS